MGLSKQSVALLASLAKVDAAVIQEAIENENEVSIELQEGLRSFTADELTQYNSNIDSEAFKRGVDQGKGSAVEMFIKEVRNEEGLQFEGKSKDNLLKALKSKYGGSKDDLLSQFEEDKAAIKKNFETQLAQSRAQLEGLQNQFLNKQRQFSLFNASPDKLTIKREHASQLFLSEVSFDKDASGREVITLGGKQMLDDMRNPIPVETVYNNWIVENKYVKGDSGRGGSDQGGGAPVNKYKAFQKEMEDKGVHTGSEEYAREQSSRMKNDPEFKQALLDSE